RLLIRCVGDQVFANQDETQRARSEIRSSVTGVRKGHHTPNPSQNLRSDATSGARVIFRDVLPDFGNILRCKRMKRKPAPCDHDTERRFSNSSSRLRRLSKNSSPSMGFTRPLF